MKVIPLHAVCVLLLVIIFSCSESRYVHADVIGQWESVTPSSTSGYLFTAMVSMQDYIYLGTDHGVYRSTDRGTTWAQINSGLNNLNINAIAIGWTYDAGNSIYTISSSSPVIVATNGGTYRSTINSAVWIAISATSTNDVKFDQFLATQGDVSTVYAATSEGVYRGINSDPTWTSGTLTWTLQNAGISGIPLSKLVTDFGNGTIYALTNDNKIYSSQLKSYSGLDENWSLSLNQNSTTTNEISILNAVGQIGWVSTTNGILKSDTAGQNWTLVNTGLGTSMINAVASDYSDSNISYAATSLDGVYRTTNEAILNSNPQIPQWLPINVGLTDLFIKDIKTNPSNSHIIFSLGANGIYRLTLNSLYTDLTRPSDVIDLEVSTTSLATGYILTWTAPGNNFIYGTSTSYDIRYSSSAITSSNFLSATPVVPMPTPWVYGHSEEYTANNIPETDGLYFALMASDTAGLQSNLSNIVTVRAAPIVTPPSGGGGSSTGGGGGTSGNGGGGGTSGGRSGGFPPQTILAVQVSSTTVTSLLEKCTQTATTPSSTLNYNFTRTLFYGTNGDDVRQLQKFLNINGFIVATTGIGSRGYESAFFGPGTRNALTRFQERYRKEILTSSGLAEGTGFFGPATIKLVNIMNQTQATSTRTCIPVTAPTKQSSTTVTEKYNFTRQLNLGSIGPDVRQLQIFLNTNSFPLSQTGVGSKGQETSYFGHLLQSALIKFQEAYSAEILIPNGLVRGTGYFGPATIKKINSMK